jgi:hypothetical protein
MEHDSTSGSQAPRRQLREMDHHQVVYTIGRRQAGRYQDSRFFVDTRLREFPVGLPHDVTGRLFVVRRVFRWNDNLPEQASSTPRWQPERGGWRLVDRVTGRDTQIILPEFDRFYSAASWYRD